jgi:hypothetical protein
VDQVDSWVFCGLFWERSDGTGALRRIRRDKSWSKQQEQDKMQKAALGQSEGSEGEREKGRGGGARKRTSSDRSDGMGGRSIMKGSPQWLLGGLGGANPCVVSSRACSHRGTHCQL